MPHRRPGWIWLGRAVAAAAIAGLATYLLTAGPARASVLAAVLGVCLAAAALAAPYLLPPGRRRQSRGPSQSVTGSVVLGDLSQLQAGRQSDPSAPQGQRVSDTWVGGNVVQADDAPGDPDRG
jgi:hypothetical protein